MTHQMTHQTKISNNKQRAKNYRSVEVDIEVMRELKKFVKAAKTKEDAAEKLNLNRSVLSGIITRGTCSSKNLNKITEALKHVA